MDDLQKVTYFGETDSRGRRVKFGIKNIDRSKHFYVIGKSGMGKSTLLENMAVQDIQNGHGMVFIDPHGGTAEKLLEYIPPERVDDVLYFAPFDMDNPIAFNIMEDVGKDKRHLVVNGLMSVFEKIWEDAWSARMAYILQNTLYALLEYPGATLLGVSRMYTDKEFRKKVVENITDVSVKSFWVDEYAKYTEKYISEATPSIQNKIGQFTQNPLIRNIIGQSKSSFDLRKIMDEKKIIIVNLSKGRVGEGNARLLGSMLITKIYLAAMGRAEESSSTLSKLPPFYLFVDEFQSFADRSFADILSEARKYKLCLTMAHQYIEQMEEEVREAVFGNVGSMLVFRVGAYDAEVLEKEFAPVFTAEDLVNLGLRQIYLKLMINSVTSSPFSATTLPPIELPQNSSVKDIIEKSRKNFAKPRLEVEKSIAEWISPVKISTAEAGVTKSPDLNKPKEPKIMYPAKKDIQPLDSRSFSTDRTLSNKSIGEKNFKPVIKPISTPNLLKKDQQASRISLKDINDKNNNQRQPKIEHVNALRDALKAVVGEDNKTKTEKTENPNIERQENKNIKNDKDLGVATGKNPQVGPSSQELKKILGIE